jgi:class 3 adenylate cyclase/predicted ATPase
MTDLRRHVPPLTLTWDDEAPGALWRVVDGTLVFADVSGFTALTEKLSRRGRIGAEEIVETLNRVFGPMLRIAASRGGELLKFGGDALLFLFRGDDHTEQACDAAVEMRAALREAAAVPTSVGRLSLQMSVGAHSGDIHLFLVGSPTRELLILGPGATATAQAEKAAEAGQIVVSPATAHRLAPDAVRPREDGELMLRRRRAHTFAPGAAAQPEADPALLATLFPHALGQYLGPAIPDPEHRLASVAFIRFSGTDAMLAGPGPDALAEALHRTVTLVEGALAPEAVTMLATDLDSDGGKFFLGSGIPTAFEDNEGRMLRALRAIADADSPLPLQLGVNRGHVFAAEVGIPERGAYTGMGDTTNTAARICAKAPAGKLYAHPAVLEHSRTRFAVEPAGPFPMKGKAVPLLVYDVGEELGTREEAVSEARLPFLGRDAELAEVREVLGAALAGEGGVLTVAGGTGMGKTRLVREVLVGSDSNLLVVRAEPYGAASAYRVFRDPIRTVLGLERDDPEVMGRALLEVLSRGAPDLLPMAPLVADVVQVDVPTTPEVDALDPQYRPDRLADTMVRLLERLRPGPLVLVAEEAHWADAASSRLLDRLATAAIGRPWAVVAIRREVPGGFAPASGVRVELAPLPPEVVEQLVIAATEATPLRPHEVAAIVDRAEGNPLYVEEVTRVALGAGSLEALPESVGAAMAAQIDLLNPHSRRVLRYCAVLGRSFRIEVLRRTLQADGIHIEPADVASLAAFIESDGPERMRFRNSLIRDAAYEGLAFRIRAQLHRTAGRTLEAMSTDLDADAATLALHFWRAGDAERTWRYAQRAGELARRAYANVDAAEQYERALEVSRRVPGIADSERAALWATLGDVRELAGVLDGSVDAYRRAAELTADPVVKAEILAKRAQVHRRAGQPRTALRIATLTRKHLSRMPEASARRLSASLDNLVAQVRLSQEKPRAAHTFAQRAADQAQRTGDAENLGSALMSMGQAEWQLGSVGDGRHFQRAMEIFESRGDLPSVAVALASLAYVRFTAGNWEEAVSLFESSRTAALRAGWHLRAAEADMNIGEILITQGRLAEGEEVVRSAMRVLRASGAEFMSVYGEQLLARVQLAGGNALEAEQRAAAVVRAFLELETPLSAFEASILQAQAALELGRPADALAIVEESQGYADVAAASLDSQVELVRVQAFIALDRLDEAEEAVSAGLRAATEQGLPYEEARLLQQRSRLKARCGARADAESDEARAQEILTTIGAVL